MKFVFIIQGLKTNQLSVKLQNIKARNEAIRKRYAYLSKKGFRITTRVDLIAKEYFLSKETIFDIVRNRTRDAKEMPMHEVTLFS